MKKSAAEALACVQSGNHIFIHSVAAAPQHLIRALADRSSELRDVQIYQLHTEGVAPYADPGMEKSFHTNCFFIGANVRKAVEEGRGSYIPVFLSEVPYLIRKEIVRIDVSLITVSPPDKHGFCSLGTSVDATRSAIEMSEIVIAQVNHYMPRTHGDAQIHIGKLNFIIEHDEPLVEHGPPVIDELTRKVGIHVASLIDDGATLQMGIGAIPNAVLGQLKMHKDLGIHTEMFSDGIIPLVESGVITGKYKVKYQGRVVATFVMGTKKLYDFVDDNPLMALLECSYVNDTKIIRQNPRVTAINSAIEIDLTGQVCADSIGSRMYSGVGGQMDFIRGASLSQGGKAIIALPSITSRGETRIVPQLKDGAGVVTTRAHVHYVVTENGIAHLYGKTLKERAKELITISHPDHQEGLDRVFHERFKSLM
jgi:acyl-CoA hydrolase